MRSLCGQLGPGDGLDPKLERDGEGRGAGSRKARQLCAQAAEALSFALAASADETLAGLTVVSVVPGPDTSRLIATVAMSPGDPFEPNELLARLDRAAGHLRSEVARSITRRKAPTIAFRISVERVGFGSPIPTIVVDPVHIEPSKT